MDRIIEVKVGGNHISKDSKNAGVRGEANVTKLRIIFDKGWDGYSKEITFWDAYGLNPVKVELTTNLIKDSAYLVPIPQEPLAEAGMMTFVIAGYADNKIQRSMSDKLEVKDSPIAKDAINAVDPTPSDLKQIQGEIEHIKGNIIRAVEAREAIENMSVSAEMISTDEEVFVDKSEKDGVVNLHFGLPKGETGNSGVYIGTSAPTDPLINVWINPNGTAYQGDVAAIGLDEDIEINVTLPASSWEGSEAPYSQTISVDGIMEDTQGTVSIAESASDEQYAAAVYAMLRKTEQEINSITIKAYGEKPTVDIPLTVRIGG